MASINVICEQCGCDMKQISSHNVVSRKNTKFKRRRLKCTNIACNHQITIHGDGSRDLEYEPFLAIEEAKKLERDLNQNGLLKKCTLPND